MITKTTKALIVEATAGSGKTSTIVDGLNYATTGKYPKIKLPDGTIIDKYKPSDEQKDVWKWLKEETKGMKSENVLVSAFSKAIADKLEKELQFGEASTIHSLGCTILRENKIKTKLDKSYKTINLFLEYSQIKDLRSMTNETRTILDDVKNLVKICKDNVLSENDINELTLKTVMNDAEYETQTHTDVLVPAIKFILEKGSILPTPTKGAFDKMDRMVIDYDDMIYIPARYGMHIKKDMIIIDEAQDVSYGKLKLLLSQECEKYVFVGDPNQAIMMFAGAMCNSFDRIAEAINDVKTLPLSFTYRCGKAIVAEAQKIVGDKINAGANNGEGKITRIKDTEMDLQVGDMLVSRVNAPLMSLAWKLVKEKKNVFVVGHQIGVGLVNLIKKINPKIVESDGTEIANDDTIKLCEQLEVWRDHQIKLFQNRKSDTSAQQINLNDKVDCIIELSGECKSVKELTAFIKVIFENDLPSIRLSSIHRAKGLEADKVYFYNPSNVPHPLAKSKEARKQEMNLKFVAITRAIKELIYVEVPDKKMKGNGE